MFTHELVAHPKNKLIILNWADYLDPDIVTEFERAYKAEVIEVYFDSDEHRTQMLVEQTHNEGDGRGYDLILTSGIDLQSYARKEWLAPIDFNQIPNSEYISTNWKNAFDKANIFGVPYFWGTVGVIYRSDLFNISEESWKVLYSPLSELEGHIGMISDGRDLTSLALKALGYSLNSTNKNELKEVEQLVLDQSSFVKSYQYMSINEQSEILSGEIWASMIYNGDALTVMKYNEDLRYFTPKEGSNLWVDYFAVGSHASNPKLAHAFINFINTPSIAARMAEYTYYATPNLEAKKLISEEQLNNTVIYPPDDIISNSEFYKPLPAKSIMYRKKISSKVLSARYEAAN